MEAEGIWEGWGRRLGRRSFVLTLVLTRSTVGSVCRVAYTCLAEHLSSRLSRHAIRVLGWPGVLAEQDKASFLPFVQCSRPVRGAFLRSALVFAPARRLVRRSDLKPNKRLDKMACRQSTLAQYMKFPQLEVIIIVTAQQNIAMAECVRISFGPGLVLLPREAQSQSLNHFESGRIDSVCFLQALASARQAPDGAEVVMDPDGKVLG